MRKPTNYGDPWKRLVAYLIDALILGTVTSVLYMIILGPMIAKVAMSASSGNEMTEQEAFSMMGTFFGSFALIMLVSLALFFFYFVKQHSGEKQATIGKRAMKLYVTDENGHRLTFGKAAIRFLGRLVNSFTMGIGYIIMFFTDKKQGLHDLIGKTLVLDGESDDQHHDELEEFEEELV